MKYRQTFTIATPIYFLPWHIHLFFCVLVFSHFLHGKQKIFNQTWRTKIKLFAFLLYQLSCFPLQVHSMCITRKKIHDSIFPYIFYFTRWLTDIVRSRSIAIFKHCDAPWVYIRLCGFVCSKRPRVCVDKCRYIQWSVASVGYSQFRQRSSTTHRYHRTPGKTLFLVCLHYSIIIVSITS